MVSIDREVYKDKIKGIWQGKIVGQTLGAPFKNRRTPMTLSFYHPVPAQAAPSEGLDIQLTWLQALPSLHSRFSSNDLAQSWREHIVYAHDEYGFAEANLKRELLPPLTGTFNNPFFEGSGAMQRAELWGILSAGAPAFAARCAYQDAILDHGAEGVWAAMFFASLISAAFVFSEPEALVTLARNFIPPECSVSRVAQLVLNAYNEEVNWEEARQRVIKGYEDTNYSHAPQNTGFALIGWLWSKNEFGAAVTMAVNCGFDTVACGGMAGAIWGALNGASHMPNDWIKPLGEKIVAGWGIKEVAIPESVSALADQTFALGAKMLFERKEVSLSQLETPLAAPAPGADTLELPEGESSSDATPAKPSLTALANNESVKPLWSRSPLSEEIIGEGISAVVSFEEPPAVVPGQTNRFIASVINLTEGGISGQPHWVYPEGWEMASRLQPMSLAPGSSVNIAAVLKPPKDARWQAQTPIEFALNESRFQFHLIPAMRWGVVGPFPNIESTGFGTYYPPEDNADPKAHFLVRSDVLEKYEILAFRDCRLEIDRYFRNAPGVVYCRTTVVSPQPRLARIHVFCNDGARVWLRRQPIFHYHYHEPFTPRPDSPFSADITLEQGENELLLKFIRCADPVEVVFYITDRDQHQMTDLQFVFG